MLEAICWLENFILLFHQSFHFHFSFSLLYICLIRHFFILKQDERWRIYLRLFHLQKQCAFSVGLTRLWGLPSLRPLHHTHTSTRTRKHTHMQRGKAHPGNSLGLRQLIRVSSSCWWLPLIILSSEMLLRRRIKADKRDRELFQAGTHAAKTPPWKISQWCQGYWNETPQNSHTEP